MNHMVDRRIFLTTPYLATLAWLLAAFGLWLGLHQFSPRVAGLVVNSLALAASVCAIAIPLGTGLALAVFKTNAFGRTLAGALLVATLLVPLYLHAAAWNAGFGMQGWFTLATNPRLTTQPLLSGWRAAVWVHAMAAVPWVVLIVGARLRAVPTELEEEAELHAPPARVLTSVSLRAALGALLVAALWVAMLCGSEISVTDLYQVRTFAEEVYTQSALGTTVDIAPFAIGLLIWAFVAAATLASSQILSQKIWAPDFQTTSRNHWIARLGTSRWLVSAIMWIVLAMVIAVPVANLVAKAGIQVAADVPETANGRVRHWSVEKAVEMVASAPWKHRRELLQSGKIGVVAATIALIGGTVLAWSLRESLRETLRESHHTPWLRLGLLVTCLTIPGPVLGVALIRCLNQPLDSPLFALTWLYDETMFAPCVAQIVRALPVATFVLWPALASVSQEGLDSATSDGASWWHRLAWVALPQRLPALCAAWLLAFAVAVGELAATILVIPPGPTTVSVRVFSLLHYGVDDQVAGLCLAVMLAVAALTISAAWLLKDRPSL